MYIYGLIITLLVAIWVTPSNIAFAKSREEAVIVQSVSNSLKTFVVRRGKIDGILIGQESLFTTKDFSLVAKAIQVTRNFSMWQISGKKGGVPFLKDEIVYFNKGVEFIWTEIPYLNRKYEESFVETFEEYTFIELKGNLTQAFSEVTSDTTTQQASSRNGIQFEAAWGKRFSENVDFAIGARLDRESVKISSPTLVIPVTRVLATIDFTLHFPKWQYVDSHFYAGIGAGIGQSSSSIDGEVVSGTVLAIPTVKFGIFNPIGQSNGGAIVETSLETIKNSDTFESGSVQDTQFYNAKLSVGYRF